MKQYIYFHGRRFAPLIYSLRIFSVGLRPPDLRPESVHPRKFHDINQLRRTKIYVSAHVYVLSRGRTYRAQAVEAMVQSDVLRLLVAHGSLEPHEE